MKNKLCLVLLAAGLVSGPAFADTGESLAQAKACFSCHDIAFEKIGPSFRDIARRFAGLNNAKPMLARIIQTGTNGGSVPFHWGPNKMPPDNARVPVDQAEAEALVDYILSLR